MRKYVKMCDFCYTDDGKVTLATGEYFDEDSQIWHVCNKHAAQVRQAKITVNKFNSKGDL